MAADYSPLRVPPLRDRPAGVIKDTELARLLEHPAIWRGRSAARTEAISTGFDALDECLPGRGWPRSGLTEILIPRLGVGELYLLMPALASLTSRPAARWCVWVTPPLDPFAPALAAHGMILERVLVARAGTSMWAFEQSLGSGACDVAMAWARCLRARQRASDLGLQGWRADSSDPMSTREIRRLQLAAERGRTLGILFRSQSAARESSPAILRMAVEPLPGGARVTLLKSRGGRNGSIEIAWHGC
jgi:hypothetical protein